MSIRIALFEDNKIYRSALEALIEGTDGYTLAGSFVNCLEAVEHVRLVRPDVVLMDIDLPGKEGIVAVREIHAAEPSVDILMLTVYDDDEKIYSALTLGAVGYLLKGTPPSKILEAIREVYEGGAPMTPVVARKVLKTFVKKDYLRTDLVALSTREREVLDFLAKGYSYKMIAAELNLSIETIRTYIKRIYEKLQVHSVTEAIIKYLK